MGWWWCYWDCDGANGIGDGATGSYWDGDGATGIGDGATGMVTYETHLSDGLSHVQLL